MAKRSPISEYLSEIGRKGGEAKVPKGLALLSAEEREAIREKALATRRRNSAAKAKPVKKHAGKGKGGPK